MSSHKEKVGQNWWIKCFHLKDKTQHNKEALKTVISPLFLNTPLQSMWVYAIEGEDHRKRKLKFDHSDQDTSKQMLDSTDDTDERFYILSLWFKFDRYSLVPQAQTMWNWTSSPSWAPVCSLCNCVLQGQRELASLFRALSCQNQTWSSSQHLNSHAAIDNCWLNIRQASQDQ